MKTFEDWPQPISLQGRGLKLHEFWWFMFSRMCDGPKRHMPKMDTKAIVTFNKSFYHLKESFGFNTEQMKQAIFFAYMTNPLSLDNPCDYGYFDVFKRSLPIFNKWYISFKEGASSTGVPVMAAIITEARKSIYRDPCTDSLMEDFMTAMNGEQ